MNNGERERILQALDRLSILARGGRWQRFWFAPRRYVYGQFFQRVVYPWRRSGRRSSAGTFWGDRMQILLPAAMDIFLLGGKTHDSELRLTRFMINHLPAGGQVADIGAHYGFFSLLAARLVGDAGRVEAFEASQSTFGILADNVLNRPSVGARRVAVSDAAGRLAFYEFPTLYTEYNTLAPEQFAGQRWFDRNPPRKYVVEAITMDDFCREHEFQPDFIKIDVEGAEDKVIGGMSSLLSNRRPVIVMEYLADIRKNEAHRRAAAQLRAWGFEPRTINRKGGLDRCEDIDGYFRESGIDSDNLVFIARRLEMER